MRTELRIQEFTNAQNKDQEIKMRFPKWYIVNVGIASVLYIMQYIVLILIFKPAKPTAYNLIDSLYYQFEAILFAIIFYSFYKVYRNQQRLDKLIIMGAFVISVERLLNQTLDTLQIVYIGNTKLIIAEFFILLATLLIYEYKQFLCKWLIQLKGFFSQYF